MLEKRVVKWTEERITYLYHGSLEMHLLNGLRGVVREGKE